jgi:hypothetical protein
LCIFFIIYPPYFFFLIYIGDVIEKGFVPKEYLKEVENVPGSLGNIFGARGLLTENGVDIDIANVQEEEEGIGYNYRNDNDYGNVNDVGGGYKFSNPDNSNNNLRVGNNGSRSNNNNNNLYNNNNSNNNNNNNNDGNNSYANVDGNMKVFSMPHVVSDFTTAESKSSSNNYYGREGADTRQFDPSNRSGGLLLDSNSTTSSSSANSSSGGGGESDNDLYDRET